VLNGKWVIEKEANWPVWFAVGYLHLSSVDRSLFKIEVDGTLSRWLW